MFLPNRWAVTLGLLACLTGPAVHGGQEDLPAFDPKNFETKLREDSEVVQAYRKRLALIADYVLMDAVPPEGLKKDSYRANLRETWVSFLDYLTALDSIGRSYGPFLHSPNRAAAKEAFDSAYWIFLAEFHYGAQFTKNLEGLADIEPLLNAPIPELGLPSGSYSAFKALAQGGEKTAELFGKDKTYFSFGVSDPLEIRLAQIQEDKSAALRLCSPLRLKELKKIGEAKPDQDGFSPWVPFLKARPQWRGKTNLWKAQDSSLSTAQVEFLLAHLEPGDLLLSRKEWYFPSVGRSGYWSQAALYTGDEPLRASFFEDPQVHAWLKARGQRGSLEDYLKKEFHDSYAACLKLDGKGHVPRVLEAVPEGVLFSSLERFAEARAICVLRPRLPKPEKAYALFRAFRFLGRPYDFNFDDESDSALTGAELVRLSYKADGKFQGLVFSLREMLGNYFSSPNAIVEQLDQTFGSPAQQWDLVVFLESERPTEKAEFNGLGELRQSWKKPKWAEAVPSQP